MSVKPLIGLLLLANVGFAVWSAGWLGGGGGPAGDGEREPQRLSSQVEGHRVRLLAPARTAPGSSSGSVTPAQPSASAASAASAAAASDPSAAASGPTARAAAAGTSGPVCLQAGPFSPEDLAAATAAVRAAAPALAADQLMTVSSDRPGRWVVYMGRFATADAAQRKQDELRRRQIAFEALQEGPAELVPGLTLGAYGRRDDAEAALAKFELRGIRTARVVTLATPGVEHRLRVEQADGGLGAQLQSLSDAALKGHGFSPCPPLAGASPAGAASSTS